MGIALKKKGFTLLMILFGLAAIIGGNVFLFSSNKVASALGADNSILLVQKIGRNATNLENNTYTYNPSSVSFPESGDPVSYLVNNQDFVMLNNNVADESLLLTEDEEQVENILITFGGEGSIIMLQASAWLNDEPINLAGSITSTMKNGLEVRQFLHTLDLKTLTKLNDLEPFTELEGYYEYLFRYRYTDGFATSEELTKTIGFWLLDENNYVDISADEEQTVVPKLYNTEKIDRLKFEGSIEHNYFNYNNFNVTDEYNPDSHTRLLFPTFVYDASRYNISYTKQLYGVTSTITSNFKIIDNVGQVDFFLNESSEPFKTDLINSSEVNNKTYYFYDNFIINDVGSYNFTIKYLYEQSNDNFITSTTPRLYEASTRDNNVMLSSFGYQMYYSKDNTDEAEFKGSDDTTNYITDYTNLNETYFNNYDTDEWTPSGEPTITGALASTNQAPVFLKSFGSLVYNSNFTISRSFYNYYVSGSRTGEKVTLPYTNNTRFTQNGYYEVVVLYNYQDYKMLNEEDTVVSLPLQLHMQVFAFKIANIPPSISLTTSGGEVMTSGKFTNASYVSATWSASGIFDVAPSATLWRQNFDGFNPYTQPQLFNGSYENVNGTQYLKEDQISTNGHYTLRVYYGPSRTTSIIYKFTIDKTPISNFQVYGVSSGTDQSENIVYLLEDNINLTNELVVNTPFTLNWNAKSSGATISAKYSFTALSEKLTPTYEQIDKDGQIWVTNGYETKSTFTNLNYYKTNSLDSDILNSNSVLKDASIYLFTLTDQAGNVYYYYVVLDNSKTAILQDPPPVSKYNYVPTTTTLTWGTHKAIEISSLSNLSEILSNGSLDTSIFDSENGQQYLLVPISQIKIYAAGLAESHKLTAGSIGLEDQRIRTFTRSGGTITPSVTFYTGLETEIPVGSEDLTGEQIYHTYVSDISNDTTSSNMSFNNVLFYGLEMNLDRSQGTAETYGTLKGDDDDQPRELKLERGSNRQYLYFNFKNSSDEYEIGGLTYSFFPLTFEQGSPNYPFASTATLNMDLLSGATLADENFYRTAYINTVYDTTYGKEVTMSGMYIITRTYIADESAFGGTGDEKVKTYTYYIDRYNIIEQLDDLLIGEYIELVLGQTQGRDPVIFKDFLISTSKETLIETNLLPVAINIPQNKYSSYNEETGIYSEGIGSFDLVVELIRKYRLPNGVDVNYEITPLSITNGKIILPQLYKDGIYEVIIKDKTGYGELLVGSNEFRFSFEIKNSKPTGTFYGTPYNGQDIALMNVGSTNENNLKFSFVDPIDIYTAKIDSDNIEIKQQVKDSSSKTVIYQKIDGSVVENPYGMEFTTTPIGHLIGSNNTIVRNRYDLQLFIENSPLSQVEATYEVIIYYEGLEEHYIYDNNNFYNNALAMTIDRTAPSFNLNRLIAADTYLTTGQKNIIKDASAEINTQNYPFAITSSFEFRRATGANFIQDTNLIYYRKYNKYATGESNLQSLIPGDDNYLNYTFEPTRPRFEATNPIYKPTNYNLGSFLTQEITTALDGDYYEIIEIDEAGNHTIYTIQVFNFGPELRGYVLSNEPEEGQEPIYNEFTRNNANQAVIDALDMYIDTIISADPWYTLRITNNVTGSPTELKHTPSTNQTNFIAQINSIIEVTDTIRITGASYSLQLINRINKGFNFNYNIQGQALLPSFVDNPNSFIITLPQDTASTTIEQFYVYRSVNGQFEQTPTYRVYNDMNGLSINATGISGVSYEFEVGEYYFYFVDNFNRNYLIPKIFGLQDIANVNFEGPTVNVEDKLYTANDVTITYQTQLYNITVTRNGESYEVPSSHISKNEQTGIEVISLRNITSIFPIPNGKNGLNDNWLITVYDSANNATNYAFTIYTETPLISLTDSLDNDLGHIIEFSTTKPVYISYTNTPLVPYTASLKLERLDANNNPIVITYSPINPEFGYYLPGTYTLSFQNILGTYKEYKWVVQETATVIYSVIANVNGLEKMLSSSSVKYSYNQTPIDQYFTKYDYRVDKNPDRNLTLTLLEETGDPQTGVTKIYNLTGDFYDKTFAVTKVPSSNNFIANELIINGFYRGGTVYKTTTNPTTLSWNSYNLFEGNYIYARYYFNGNYVGQINSNSVVLEDAGIYYFEFYDFAGNNQIFNTENYYRIVLISEVLYSMNGLNPVNDMIYNENVSLQIEHINEYNWRSWSNVVTRNGYAYTPLKVGEAYIFTEFGLYIGELTATVTLPNESETKTITANYSFTILNKNEAKLSFEYSPQTGYEILSIIKDGINVTNQFKTLYNSNTLTRLFLSKEEGGNGNYVVTVNANYLTLKPSQTFSFEVWINNELPIILTSIKQGATTTKNIMLTFNKYLIYQQVGEAIIKINGADTIIINAETSSVNAVTNYELSVNATYLVQLQTSMGNTVLSFKVIKKAPLNSIAIFLIIAGSLIVTTLTIVFIKLRTKMRVS